ncbi:hypothetical protein BC826DRAFT_1049856 [Russula brevipes]|nr:hypothetical protein BC826DRAFT_1049856 [Russula brevipes]
MLHASPRHPSFTLWKAPHTTPRHRVSRQAAHLIRPQTNSEDAACFPHVHGHESPMSPEWSAGVHINIGPRVDFS